MFFYFTIGSGVLLFIHYLTDKEQFNRNIFKLYFSGINNYHLGCIKMEEIFESCGVDPWFLYQIKDLVLDETKLKESKIEELNKLHDNKLAEYNSLSSKDEKTLWKEDLEKFKLFRLSIFSFICFTLLAPIKAVVTALLFNTQAKAICDNV